MNTTTARLFICFDSPSEKWTVKRITINLSSDEAMILEKYSNQTGIAVADVIRELIRKLP